MADKTAYITVAPADLVFDTTSTTQKLTLKGKTNRKVAFKVKTTAPRRYCVRPNSGIIDGFEEVTIDVILQPVSKSAPIDKKSKTDKFLVQSVPIEDNDPVADAGALIAKYKDKAGEHKLRCIFSEERASPRPVEAAKKPSGSTPSTPIDSKPAFGASKPIGAPASSPLAALGDARANRDMDDHRIEMERLKNERQSLRDELNKARSELQMVRSQNGSELRNRFPSKSGGASDAVSAKPAGSEGKKGFSLAVLLIVAVVMFALGFWLNDVILE